MQLRETLIAQRDIEEQVHRTVDGKQRPGPKRCCKVDDQYATRRKKLPFSMIPFPFQPLCFSHNFAFRTPA